jgi:hypothetical protein
MNYRRSTISLILILSAAVACQKKTATPFTGDPTKPIAPIDSSFGSRHATSLPGDEPDAVQSTPHTKYCFMVDHHLRTGFHVDDQGQTTDGNGPYSFADGGGCISKPLKDLWATAMDLDYFKWDGGDTYQVDAHPKRDAPKPGTHDSYSVRYHSYMKSTPTLYGDYLMHWFFTLKTGTEAAPESVLINYVKTAGISNIHRWEGTIILERISDTVTSFGMRDQELTYDENDAQISSKEVASGVEKMFDLLSKPDAPVNYDRFKEYDPYKD